MIEESSHLFHRSDFKINRAGIITKIDDPEAVSYGRELIALLQSRDVSTELNRIVPDLDILIILGGDGTLLHVAEKAAHFSIPVIGINLGNLGFLTELTKDESSAALDDILSGSVTMEKRQMLKARRIRGENASRYSFALNEVVINKNTLDQLLLLSTSANGHLITTYKADGLIFSTPTGSTAYNLSAGGPLVHPGLSTILVTPICPFMLSSRPIILPPDQILTSQFTADRDDRSAKIIIDGQVSWDMFPGDILEIQTAEHPLHLISSKNRDYFEILRNKLQWGGNK
ncbi:MAG: NAD(+)/NADH kinase [Desulfocapsaceae bacterium]|jgi:NAD+ kinase|nr:NAD(+)/NADH kinase [Desulfocapsaceae bacterium]